MASPGVPVDWTTYHFDETRSGAAPNVPRPGRLRRAWSARLDGAVYGQPLVIGETVVAATEGDSVYGLDRASGKVLWHTSLGTPVPLSMLPCGDINPLGITGTPVYDRGTGRVFVVAETSGFHHVLFGLSVRDGSVQITRDIPAPDGNPANDQQQAALLLANRRIYVAFGGLYGDCGQYIGSIVSIPVSGRGTPVVWKVPTQRKGGIAATAGPTAGLDGTLYVAVGNGAATQPPYDGSDSITALTPDLKVKWRFAPEIWGNDNAYDRDLGSMAPAILPERVLEVGKRGIAYLLRNPDLDGARGVGGAGGADGIGGEITQTQLCTAYGSPSAERDTVYLPCSDGTTAVTTVGDQIRIRWRGPSETDGSPVIGGDAVWTTGAGALYALDQWTGTLLARIDIGRLPRLASPTLSGGLALVGTTVGVVAVSGA